MQAKAVVISIPALTAALPRLRQQKINGKHIFHD
jgi:hypothetical protein